MPLSAIVDGRKIAAPDLSEEEWADLALRHKNGLPVTMACCGAPGHLRRSRRGTRHFYHAGASACHYAGESAEHLEIKNLVYRTCNAAGWETCTEYPAPGRDWISDVYAAGNGRQIVFEIQISPLPFSELDERDRKYRDAGIESYWLLECFSGKAQDPVWPIPALPCEEDVPGGTVPYIDDSLFHTGPENRLFLARGIRSIGLVAGKQTLFTTNNPGIPVDAWVREVLKGNYLRYLETTAAVFRRRHRLRSLAAPHLVRLREFYTAIVRDNRYRKKLLPYARLVHAGDSAGKYLAFGRHCDGIAAEIDWLENEYRSCMAESSGLFAWKTLPGDRTPRPFFRLESEPAIRMLEGCVTTFKRWEASFDRAMEDLEREVPRE